MKVTSLISWDMETGAVLSHVYTEGYDGPIERCDRSIAKAAGNQAGTNEGTAGQYGAGAAQIGSSIIPGLEREAQGGQGLTPIQKNNALVSGAEAIGGVNSGITGDANLAAARTRNAGGFTGALDEAARIKSRQQSANALGVNAEDTALANEKQMAAQKQLAGLYGTDTSAQLHSMGLANEDLNTQLAAGKQGWLQNTEGVINTLANAYGAYKGGK
jgi:hypothetical protein